MTDQQVVSREEKNAAVFGGNASETQAVTRIEQLKADLGFEFPTVQVPLPSKGLVYPPTSPFHNKTHVEIKCMTTQEEDILTNTTAIKKNTVISDLIKSCMADPHLNTNELLSGDRNALMIAIRITGYGSEYIPTMKCPSCGVPQEVRINLSELDINVLGLEPIEPWTNSFSFTFPVCKEQVVFKFTTGKDEEEILTTLENKEKKGLPSSNLVSNRLFYSIIAIGGQSDRAVLAKKIKYLHAGDSKALRQYIDKFEPSVRMIYSFECSSSRCSHAEEVLVPMTSEFFFPKTRG